MHRAWVLLAASGLASLTSCEKRTLPPLPPLTVSVTPVIEQSVFENRTWVGLLDGYQNADIRAQVSGYLISQNYKEGSLVKKDTVLFEIDPRPFQAALAQAQADYGKAVAQAQLSEITLGRQTELYKTKVISQQEYDTAYQNAAASTAQAAAAQAAVQSAQINLAYCTIKAPFDGIAGVAQAQIGDLVGPGGTATVLTQMSQVNPIKVNFSITEQEFLVAAPLIQELQNRTASEKQAKISLKLADGTEYPEKGTFDFVNRQIDVSTGSIQIIALFSNDNDLLRPGMFARVTAPVRQIPNALLVPQAAVVELQGNHLISIVGPDNVIQTRPVVIGFTEGQNQVILKGLQAGENVVVEGVEKVRPGMKVNTQPYKAPDPSTQKTEAAPAAATAPAAAPAASTPPTAAPATPPAATPASSQAAPAPNKAE